MSMSDKLLELRTALLLEKIVDFDGQPYDIPADEIKRLKTLMKRGDQFRVVAGEFEGEDVEVGAVSDDRAYTDEKGVDRLSTAFKEPIEIIAANAETDTPRELYDVKNGLEDILSVFGNGGGQALRILQNFAEESPDNPFPLFSHREPNPPTHPAVAALMNLESGKRGSAFGKGEILAALLYGFRKQAAGGEIDVDLAGGPHPGKWHIKDVRSSGTGGGVSWGQGGEGFAAFHKSLDDNQALNTIERKQLKKMISGAPKGLSAGTAEYWYTTTATDPGSDKETKFMDAIDTAITAMVGAGDAKGVLFITDGGFEWLTPAQVKFNATEKSTGRVRVNAPADAEFKDRAAVSTRNRTNKAQALAVAGQKGSPSTAPFTEIVRALKVGDGGVWTTTDERAAAFNADQLKNLIRRLNALMVDGKIAPNSQMRLSGTKQVLLDTLIKYLDTATELKESLFNLRVNLLVEELTRSDKKDIQRMIAKHIEADRSEQKKQAQKQFEAELKKVLGKDLVGGPAKINKAIEKIAKRELQKGLKGQELKDAMAEVTKLVLRKLYREMSYSYTPVIDRIKI